jgi:transposase
MLIPLERRTLKKILKLIKDDKYDIWAIDEVHFQQYGSCCRMWIPPEVKEPILLHHPTRASVGYYGAVRLRDGKFAYKSEWDKFNGETFFSFLKYLRRISSHSGRKAIIISDNARYHHAKLHKTWREKCSKQFELMYLPPYSPELNPIERVWKLTRRMAVHNRYFSSLQSVADAIESLFNTWSSGNNTLFKLCAII